MKIKSIHIYGFGKLENLIIEDLSAGIHVFQGENEAGKSTIMAFIHAILFGFPAKNQQDLRYEPKKGAAYGGKLLVEAENGRLFHIERIAGKQAGDVSVVNEKGKPITLDEVLGGIDKNMFKTIFSFNIMDIQNVKLIDLDELGSFLFSSGIIGNDKLHRLSQELTKEQEELFKPGGRKPEMNKLLGDLKEQQKAVWLWEEKLAGYEKLLLEVEQLQETMLKTKESKREREENVKYIETMLSIQPIQEKLERVKAQLGEMEDLKEFPQDAIARLEKWQTEKNFYLTKYEKLQSDRQELEEVIANLSVDHILLAKENLLEELVAERPHYEQRKEKWTALKVEKENLEKQLMHLQQDLNWQSLDRKTILTFDTSMASKAEMKELHAKNQELINHKKRLDDHFKVLRDELEKQEIRVKTLEDELLPAKEVEEMESVVLHQNLESVKQEVKLTEQLITQLERQMDFQEKENLSKHRKTRAMAIVAMMIGIACSGYFFIQNNLIAAGILLVLTTLIIAVSAKPRTGNDSIQRMKAEYVELKKKLEGLKKKFYSSDASTKVEDFKARLSKQESVKGLLEKERLLLSQCERAYNRNIEQFEEWEKERIILEEKWNKWAGVRNFNDISVTFIEEAFEKAVLLKQVISSLDSIDRKIELLQQSCQEFQSKVVKLSEGLNDRQTGVTVEENLTIILSRMNKEAEKREKVKKIKRELEALVKESSELYTQFSGAEKQIQLLYQLGNVKDEEEYRKKSEQSVVSSELEKEFKMLTGQHQHLKKLYQISIEEFKPMGVWKAEKDQEEKVLYELIQQEQDTIEKMTAVKETIRQLEEEGSYSDAVQKLELSKGRLQEYARKWAVYATAQNMLMRTIEYYRDVKLPKVLEKASMHFQYLTGGKYSRILDNVEQKKLYVQHQDGTVYIPKELSQATIEQLYISIRLAVASVWGEQKYPFMIDDSFVNFDQQRTEKAVSLLAQLADEGEQIIFFTCHNHLKDIFAVRTKSMISTMETGEMGKVTLLR